MGVFRNKWLWLSVLGVLLSGGLLLVVVGYLALVVYSGLVTGAPIAATLLEIALPVLAVVTLLVAVLAVSSVGALWVFVRHASLPRSERVASAAERLEREYSPLRMLGLSEFLSPPEPSPEERADRALADLKERYVDGDITEAEFERRVDRLVANESIDEARAARERRRVVDEETRHR
ncbi:SHOCT domain-containing protein [Natrinema sp. 1APR25-10V2]|uniref:SHOCT domain-containing protein n=1 Tax=Natrinema sp. 1APR25-10V2 TaxID=2951081 RepID=UPI0028759693|nr:SHOCT domain-containing protein [Natrinema sp. 1APR25-10V2]MDS0473590.1 SHOCT domain-containing protein [Natrinema sp. 1APR25-10V2]